MAAPERDPQAKRVLWGKILFFVGLGLGAFGLVLAALLIPVGMGSVEEALGLANVATSLLCCFGPFGLLGLLGVIVGAVLWFGSGA